MMKKLIVLLSVLMLPVYAGTYEDSLLKSDRVFLYLYTTDCRVCNMFDSIYKKISAENKDFNFVKVNADTSYGRYLMIKFRGRYVPYIILTDTKSKRSVNVSHSCVMDDVCLLRAMKSFKEG